MVPRARALRFHYVVKGFHADYSPSLCLPQEDLIERMRIVILIDYKHLNERLLSFLETTT